MAKPRIECVVEPAFGENAYVVWLDECGPCWIVDPGLPPSAEQLCRHIERRRLALDAIVLTHAHADHIAGLPEVLERFPRAPVFVARGEQPLLSDAWENLSAGLGTPIVAPVRNPRDLEPGMPLSLGSTSWSVLDVSGHSPAGRALHCPAGGLVLVGDALFAGSIGRTDFPHSRHADLLNNIRRSLFTLPDDTVVYSGHGPPTTIGRERRSNPWVGVHAGRDLKDL